MIVEKNGRVTEILEVHASKYISNGWKVVDEAPLQPANEAARNIANNLDPKQAAVVRKETPVKDAVSKANAIAAIELRKPAQKRFNDGLIKNEEK